MRRALFWLAIVVGWLLLGAAVYALVQADNYWIAWPAGAFGWFLIGWALFAILEAKALRRNARKNQVTLSFLIYTVGSKFPLSILLAGLIIGGFVVGLGVHFFWHWCPPGSISAG